VSDPIVSDLTDRLKAAGLSVTAQRLAVHRAVASLHHASAEQICEQVRLDIGAVSRQAVYDALQTLREHGIVRRFEPAGSSTRYETRVDNHHHLICRTCGSMRDVDCAKGKAPCLHPVEDHGYRIDEAEVIYWGTCPDCIQQATHNK
jgi:Fur family ferric uptake transcriptional regulator